MKIRNAAFSTLGAIMLAGVTTPAAAPARPAR
jgi:hypothetical protein